MAHRTLQDPASLEYAAALDHLWSSWDPALRRAERVLEPLAGAQMRPIRFADPAEVLGAAQYRAHLTSERALGLTPPLVAFEAHRYFVDMLGNCRDSLGALRSAQELGEGIDEDAAAVALHALQASREAFHAANYAMYAVERRAAVPGADAVPTVGPPAWALWGLVGVATATLLTITLVILMLQPGH